MGSLIRFTSASIIGINALECLSCSGCALPFINHSPTTWVVKVQFLCKSLLIIPTFKFHITTLWVNKLCTYFVFNSCFRSLIKLHKYPVGFLYQHPYFATRKLCGKRSEQTSSNSVTENYSKIVKVPAVDSYYTPIQTFHEISAAYAAS